MKKENIEQFDVIAKQIEKQDKAARRLLANKIYKLYSSFLRACPNIATDKKFVCIIERETDKIADILVTKESHTGAEVYISGYWSGKSIMTDYYGGAFTSVELINFDIRTLAKIYKITYEIFSGESKKYTFQ